MWLRLRRRVRRRSRQRCSGWRPRLQRRRKQLRSRQQSDSTPLSIALGRRQRWQRARRRRRRRRARRRFAKRASQPQRRPWRRLKPAAMRRLRGCLLLWRCPGLRWRDGRLRLRRKRRSPEVYGERWARRRRRLWRRARRRRGGRRSYSKPSPKQKQTPRQSLRGCSLNRCPRLRSSLPSSSTHSLCYRSSSALCQNSCVP
mmetsp:Transcript_2118/g.6947  ORF Transcript_2118/g.6947 Transcript_2118/m.6947 type:complete len:201 (-) Transcript_2118:360-962(-)